MGVYRIILPLVKGCRLEFSAGPSVDSLHVLNGAILARSQGKVWILVKMAASSPAKFWPKPT